MAKKNLVKYTNRDFESIRRELEELRRRYYSNISSDENESSVDALLMDMIALVGDNLSFYLDYQTNESFLDTSIEFGNILKIGKTLGYKYKANPSSFGVETLFVIVPANASGLGPDLNYVPVLKKGSEFGSLSGVGFILNEDVSFARSTNQVVVARVDETNGLPTAYAIKAFGEIISGKIIEEIIDIGEFQKFLKLELAGQDIAEIVSVEDSEGNEYFETEYLSQDVIYKAVANRGENSVLVPFLLRPVAVPRRFVVDREKNITFLQFGFGSERDASIDPIIDPSQVILDVHGKDYVSDVSFDPSNLLGTDKLGIAPSNTRLRVVYRVNTSDNVNASVNAVVEVINPIVEFQNVETLNTDIVRSVIDSIEITNEKSIVGDTTTPTPKELKIRIFDKFASQNRAVTEQDYKSLVYSMPPKFGAIKRVNVNQDADSFKRNINLYVISEDSDGTLTETNETLKTNLKYWINSGRMINDTIDILDAKLVNLGVDFIVAGDIEMNKYEILNNCTIALQNLFKTKEDVGTPFSISNVYKVLGKAKGVVDVVKVRLSQKKGANYASTRVDLESLISSDGRFIDTPKNVIFEVKFPQDIRGVVR